MFRRSDTYSKLGILFIPSLLFILIYLALYGLFGIVTNKIKPMYHSSEEVYQEKITKKKSDKIKIE